ncbi:hypothetical protein [Falsiroseomonas tokyonensis]|uniref:Uncharacterized protein n=1 Tax=Falsiroseomonas tokyonensis TaxID=430521 RepID=A0ABV7BW87_9PROT|nr:hypothetical protein [Falsiroseomonas tokyonensis]MBU8538263.1 hypothetical protein [Falsiroseomonas tokyonensis]
MVDERAGLPVTTWPRELLLTTILAYRNAHGAGLPEGDCVTLAVNAYLGAGGNPDLAQRAPLQMIASISGRHPEWFWRPAHRRMEREARFWKARRQWPPPLNRSTWPPIPDDT